MDRRRENLRLHDPGNITKTKGVEHREEHYKGDLSDGWLAIVVEESEDDERCTTEGDSTKENGASVDPVYGSERDDGDCKIDRGENKAEK